MRRKQIFRPSSVFYKNLLKQNIFTGRDLGKINVRAAENVEASQFTVAPISVDNVIIIDVYDDAASQRH